MKKIKFESSSILVCLIIGICFCVTGSGYLSWLYKLMNFYSDTYVDMLSEVIGYLFQAIGLIIFTWMRKKEIPFSKNNKGFIITLIIDYILIVFSVLSISSVSTLIFGYAMNIFHGLVAGYYLFALVTYVPLQHRGKCFGFGYAIGALGSWGLSLWGNGNFLKSNAILILYAILIIICIVSFKFTKNTLDLFSDYTGLQNLDSKLLLMILALVFLLSFVKNTGFYFPTADLSSGAISLEFTRLFYAAGLIIAGFVNDYSRKTGSVICICALVIPFIMLTLVSNATSSNVLWMLGYVFYGFFVVYRIILVSDYASQSNNCFFGAALGLMFGRLGDAFGALIGMKISNITILVSFSGILFVITILLYFQLFPKLYILPAASTQKSFAEIVDSYSKHHNFTSREKEIFVLLLEGNTNNAISEKLYISDNTVKFHIKNILKKTQCQNRGDLKSHFEKYQYI